jgi:hypothetical protein
MVTLVAVALLATCSPAHAEEYQQLLPNGRIDYNANKIVREGDTFIQVMPNGRQDYNAPVVKIEDGKAVTYRSDGRRDWNAPTWEKK